MTRPTNMIDLHCHLLPGIDDGPESLEISLEMARMAVADGITHTACTPHIYPGLHENTRDGIKAEVLKLQHELDRAGVALTLMVGADVHAVPEVLANLQSGHTPTVNDTHYFLLEPSHYVLPPNFEQFVSAQVSAGYVPIITHPERLHWIDEHYPLMKRLVEVGALMQVTAGSLTGQFGRKARYWGRRMLTDGLVHILASDAHHPDRRPPNLRAGFDAACALVGEEEAVRLVQTRPSSIIQDASPDTLAPISFKRAPLKVTLNRVFVSLGILSVV